MRFFLMKLLEGLVTCKILGTMEVWHEASLKTESFRESSVLKKSPVLLLCSTSGNRYIPTRQEIGLSIL